MILRAQHMRPFIVFGVFPGWDDMAEKENRKTEYELTGTFSATSKGFGFFTPETAEDEEAPADIFIPAKYRKNAFDGDTVVVKVYKPATKTARAEGEVVRILKRGTTDIIGVFKAAKDKSGMVVPDDRKIEALFNVQREHTKGAKDGQKVVMHITDYGGDKRPKGRVSEILGDADDPKTDFKTVLRMYDIMPQFTMEVANEAEAIPDKISEKDIDGRLDLRNETIVTIDGADAKDLDDAVAVKRIDGGYELSVHIADVSHYVTEGSALDESALKRGTSVYLINKVVPMLPQRLSNGICSLNAGQDRLALSCIMETDENGRIRGHRIAETAINVTRRMNYDEVAGILKDPDEKRAEYGELTDMFLLMKELSDKLRANRRSRGALDFNFEECKIKLDENDAPVDIFPDERNDASKLIEDFMLAANETVAEDYYWQDLPFLFRTHEAPDEDKINKLSMFVKNFGYVIKGNKENVHPKELQKLLDSITGTDEEPLISRLTLRSMRQARYTTEALGHFGLSAQYYCHFTSPIRRYPDLQIHRIIKENLHGTLDESRKNHYNTILGEVAAETSRLERRAENAERDLEKWKHAEYMEKRIGEVYEGVISGLSTRGIYVELPNTVEGIVTMGNLKDDFYVFDAEHFLIAGEKKHKTYSLGQKLFVEVIDVDKTEKETLFTIIGEKRYRAALEKQTAETAAR